MTPEITAALTGTLLHFLWQGAAIAFLLSLLLIVFRDASAQLRYACCCAALALCAILPAVTFFITLQAKPRASVALALELLAAPAIATTSGTTSGTSGAFWNDWVLLLWAVGVMACSTRLILGQYGAWKLRQGEPITGELAQRVREIASEMGWNRGIAIIKSTLVEVPSVTGWLKPVLLIPPAALMGLTTAQLEAVVAHELAHVRRHDYVVNVLQAILETLLFYHPAVWWISRQIRQEREYCCDDAAVAITGDAVLYARALASLEHLRRAEQNLTKAFLGASTGGNLMKRMQRLHRRVAGGNSARQTSGRWAAAAPVAGLCGLACAVWIAVLTPGLALGQSEQEPARTAPQIIEERAPAEDAPEDVNNAVEAPPAGVAQDAEPETQRNIQREIDRQVRREIQRNVEREIDRTLQRNIQRNIERQVRIAQATAQEAASAAQRSANENPMSDAERAQLRQQMERSRQQFAEGGEFQKEMEELRKQFAPGGELQKEMEQLREQFAEGGEFQKRMEEQFGKGSDFQKRMEEQFGKGSDFQKRMEEQFGKDSDFQKRMEEQFGKGSDFQKRMEEQFGEGSDFQKRMEDLRKQFGENGQFQRNLQQLERTLPQQEQPETNTPEANQARLWNPLPQWETLPLIERNFGNVGLTNPLIQRPPLPPPVELAQIRPNSQQELERTQQELERARQQVIKQEQRIREEAEQALQQGAEQRAAQEEAAAQAKQELQRARRELERTQERMIEQKNRAREVEQALQRAEQESQQVREEQRLVRQKAEQTLQRTELERRQARDEQRLVRQKAEQALQQTEQERQRVVEQVRQQQVQIQELKREIERLQQERQQQAAEQEAVQQ